MRLSVAAVTLAIIAASASLKGCKQVEPGELDGRPTISISIKQRPFELWVSDDADERERGLKQVTAEQMATLPDGTERGMLFVFDYEQRLWFWMKDTIIPLDIAYVTSSGVVVATHTMAPLDTRIGEYPSTEPVRFAIEVNAGLWEELGLAAGDRIDIPASVLKRNP